MTDSTSHIQTLEDGLKELKTSQDVELDKKIKSLLDHIAKAREALGSEQKKSAEEIANQKMVIRKLKDICEETSERGNQRLPDILRCASMLLLVLPALIVLIWFPQWSAWAGLPAVVGPSLYILAILYAAAYRSDVKMGSHTGDANLWDVIFPTRRAGIVLVLLFLTAFVLGFANLYSYAGIVLDKCNILDTPMEAIYFSFVTLTTLGYGDFSFLSNLSQWLVMAELFSGVLLLVCTFALLIARLSIF